MTGDPQGQQTIRFVTISGQGVPSRPSRRDFLQGLNSFSGGQPLKLETNPEGILRPPGYTSAEWREVMDRHKRLRDLENNTIAALCLVFVAVVASIVRTRKVHAQETS